MYVLVCQTLSKSNFGSIKLECQILNIASNALATVHVLEIRLTPRAELPLHLYVEIRRVSQSLQHQWYLLCRQSLLLLISVAQDHPYQLWVPRAHCLVKN